MDWANLIVTVLAFLIIFLHQRHRIKNLSDQIKGQQDIFNNMKSYIDSINPDLFAKRTEQYEKLIEKQAEVQIKEMEAEFKEKEKSEVESRKKALQWLLDLTGAITRAMPHLNASTQLDIVEEIKAPELKNIFKNSILPQAKKIQIEIKKSEYWWITNECNTKLLSKLLSGENDLSKIDK